MQIGELWFLYETVALVINIYNLTKDLIHTLTDLLLLLLVNQPLLFLLQVNAVLKEFGHLIHLPVSLFGDEHKIVPLLHLHFRVEQARVLLCLIKKG